MDRVFIKQILEALIFVSERPITFDEIQSVLDDYDTQTLLELIKELKGDFEGQKHSIKIVEIGGGYQFVTDPEMAPHLNKLYHARHAHRLSKASLETLAIIAYRQPITKLEIEVIRGVNVDGSVKTLLERNLIRISGRKEAVGRPILYSTTKKFLEHFGLNSLEELPELPEFTEKDLEFARDDNIKVALTENEAKESGSRENNAGILNKEEEKTEISKVRESQDEHKETPS